MTEAARKLLEQHFDIAFAAPDGIAKLRGLILTLAMQGKLVEQDPNDPPASELLKEIEADKQRLVKEGKIKKSKALPPTKQEELPYELPGEWKWVRLADLGTTQTGTTPPSKNIENYGDYIPFVGPGNIKNGCIDYSGKGLSEQGLSKGRLIEANSVLMVCIGGSIGKHAINERDTTCNQQINTLTPHRPILVKYIYCVMATGYFQNAVISQAGGSATPIINKQKWSDIPVPLPPLPEQHRIVARIDQLMARCDALETLRKQQEGKRLAVHAAAIKQLLDTPDGSAWDFIGQHFGELYIVKENVTELRKAILQLAVMGRLVPQNPNDPPASELLKEIKAEKQRLLKEGKIKKSKALPSIKPEEVPYELPQGWEWVRLGELSEIIGGFAYKSALFKNEGDKQVLRLGNIRPDQLRLSENPVFIDDDQAESTSNYCLIAGDILISMTGTREKRDYLYSVQIDENPINGKYLYLNQRVGAIRAFIDTKYLNKAIKVESIKDIIYRTATGSANQANIGISALRDWTLPLPPLPEQHRIVARIDQLMALCDTLEQQIDAATGKQTGLLNVVMAQV